MAHSHGCCARWGSRDALTCRGFLWHGKGELQLHGLAAEALIASEYHTGLQRATACGGARLEVAIELVRWDRDRNAHLGARASPDWRDIELDPRQLHGGEVRQTQGA